MHLFRSARRLVALAAVLAAAGVITGCVSAQPAPLTIETILPLTGPVAFAGQAAQQTLQAFEKWANATGGVRGTPIHFNVHDDQSSPQVAVQLTNAAIERHVAVIMGPSAVSTCSAAGAIVENTGPVLYCFSPGFLPKKDSYAFASTSTINGLVETVFMYAKLRGFHRLAYIGATDATGQLAAVLNHELLKLPKFAGLTQVADESMGATDPSAAAQVATIKAARPDVIWTPAIGTTFATIMRALSDAGLDIPVLTSGANGSPALLKPIDAYLPDELYFNGYPFQLGSALKDKGMLAQGKIFNDAFKAIGAQPTGANGNSWDAPLIVLAAYRTYGPTMTAAQLKSFILAQRHFLGVNGYYDFSTGDQHGVGANSVAMVGWDKTKQEFYPASQPGGMPIKR